MFQRPLESRPLVHAILRIPMRSLGFGGAANTEKGRQLGANTNTEEGSGQTWPTHIPRLAFLVLL